MHVVIHNKYSNHPHPYLHFFDLLTIIKNQLIHNWYRTSRPYIRSRVVIFFKKNFKKYTIKLYSRELRQSKNTKKLQISLVWKNKFNKLLKKKLVFNSYFLFFSPVHVLVWCVFVSCTTKAKTSFVFFQFFSSFFFLQILYNHGCGNGWNTRKKMFTSAKQHTQTHRIWTSKFVCITYT